jgi:hypothetical protein
VKYDRELLLGKKRNEVLDLHEVQQYGLDSFDDADYVSLYGLAPADWFARGVRALGRTAVECTRDRLAAAIAADVALVAADAHAGSHLLSILVRAQATRCTGCCDICPGPSASPSKTTNWCSDSPPAIWHRWSSQCACSRSTSSTQSLGEIDDNLQPALSHGARHEPQNAPTVERDDENQVGLSEGIVSLTDGGYDHGGIHAPGFLQNRKPKVEMLVVSAGDELVFAEVKDRPRPDLVPDDVAGLHLRTQHFGRGWNFQTEARRQPIAQDQNGLHPLRVVAEDREEDLNDVGSCAREWRAISIVVGSSLDQTAIERAEDRYFASGNAHVLLEMSSEKRRRSTATLVEHLLPQ